MEEVIQGTGWWADPAPPPHELHTGSGRDHTLSSVVGVYLLPSAPGRRWFLGLAFRDWHVVETYQTE